MKFGLLEIDVGSESRPTKNLAGLPCGRGLGCLFIPSSRYFNRFVRGVFSLKQGQRKNPVRVEQGLWHLVPRVGLEPTHLAAGDFESPASTNFATWAGVEDWHYTAF